MCGKCGSMVKRRTTLTNQIPMLLLGSVLHDHHQPVCFGDPWAVRGSFIRAAQAARLISADELHGKSSSSCREESSIGSAFRIVVSIIIGEFGAHEELRIKNPDS